MGAKKRVRYRAVVGLDYSVSGEHRRVEPGEVVSDIPAGSVGWLLGCGAVEEVSDDADAAD